MIADLTFVQVACICGLLFVLQTARRIMLVFYIIGTFFTAALFIALIYAGIVLLGMAEFKWKKPPLPPPQNAADPDQQAKEVDEFLAERYGERFEVRSVSGRIWISTTPDCPLSDETILASLTTNFPRLIFRISRSLYDSVVN